MHENLPSANEFPDTEHRVSDPRPHFHGVFPRQLFRISVHDQIQVVNTHYLEARVLAALPLCEP
jgi:hypothetical protein